MTSHFYIIESQIFRGTPHVIFSSTGSTDLKDWACLPEHGDEQIHEEDVSDDHVDAQEVVASYWQERARRQSSVRFVFSASCKKAILIVYHRPYWVNFKMRTTYG